MLFLRPITWIVSLGLHAGLLLAIVGVTTGGAAYDVGTGSDAFVVEQGVALEGVAKFGDAEEMIETVDIPPVQPTKEPHEVEEIEPELTNVVTSTESSHEEQVVIDDPKPIEEEKPVAVPLEEQAPQIATLIEKSSGAAQEGGDASARMAYFGTLSRMLERNKVNPRSRLAGSVLMSFTVGPTGQVIAREVKESSGFKRLDEAAMATIDRATFPPMPENIAQAPVELQVRFKFRTQ